MTFRGLLRRLRGRDTELEALRRRHPTCVFYDGCRAVNSAFGIGARVLSRARLNQVTLGDCSYVSLDSALSRVTVGRFCSIGQQVLIGLSRHPSRDFVSTYPGFFATANEGAYGTFVDESRFDEAPPATRLEHDVWIGHRVIVPGGITIGTGAIVAAGSVVTKDVEPYAVVGGNPAQVIRFRFKEEEIAFLLESRWWDWPVEHIARAADAFDRFERFRAVAEGRVR